MHLKRVVRNLNGPSLNAVVVDKVGTWRKIDFSWQHKDGSEAAIPEVWWDTVQGEVGEALSKERRGPGPSDL